MSVTVIIQDTSIVDLSNANLKQQIQDSPSNICQTHCIIMYIIISTRQRDMIQTDNCWCSVYSQVQCFPSVIQYHQMASMSTARVVKPFHLPSSLQGKWIMG